MGSARQHRSLQTQVQLAVSYTDYSIDRLSQRWKAVQTPDAVQVLTFDKDDVDTLDFVAATSNIRSIIFSIPAKSKFDIKRIPSYRQSKYRNGRKYHPCNRNDKCDCSRIMRVTSTTCPYEPSRRCEDGVSFPSTRVRIYRRTFTTS
jgi:hypothetical protein